MEELLKGSSTVVYEKFRMIKVAFVELCKYFESKEWVKNSKFVNADEKIAMFLWTISHNNRNRAVKYQFQHSGEAVSRYFHEVLNAMINFAKQMIVPPKFDEPMEVVRSHVELREGPFRGAVGALDGTLVDANIPISQQVPFRGRGQGQCCQNVMEICDFDMKFIYVMAGWEGIAHDSRVLNETLRNPSNNFPMPPPDMYYLCDAAYAHTRGFMTPYWNTRYWLKTYRSNRPANKKEKFNHEHAQLRNVIERSFGVLKKRFPILDKMPSYFYSTQRDLVIACMAIHNFLRCVSLDDELFRKAEVGEYDGEEDVPSQPGPSYSEIFPPQAQTLMANLRDQIADQL